MQLFCFSAGLFHLSVCTDCCAQPICALTEGEPIFKFSLVPTGEAGDKATLLLGLVEEDSFI